MGRTPIRLLFILCLGMVSISLTGCVKGGVEYQVIYPSGYVRDPYVKDEITPVEGTSYQLRCRKSEDHEKTRAYDLEILDETGEVLYTYPKMGSTTIRGEAGDRKDTIWVCSESWSTPHHNGYLSTCLDSSHLFLLNMQNGEIVFQTEEGDNELYLTSTGDRCYFYFQGKWARDFGLFTIPAKNAEIYYRDTSDWGEKHTVSTFGYAMTPKIGTNHTSYIVARFFLEEDRIRVSWICHEYSNENGWEDIEREAYDVPIEVDGPKADGAVPLGHGECR